MTADAVTLRVAARPATRDLAGAITLRVAARPATRILAATGLCLLLAGCSSTREQASKFAADGNAAFRAKGLSVARANRDVEVVSRAIVRDANGTAVVVKLRNRGRRALSDLPIAVTVTDRAGRAVYRNDAPGLEKGLVRVTRLEPDHTFTWVNDQVQASGTPARVVARVGRASSGPAGMLSLPVGTPRLEGDPTSGISAVGTLTNTTARTQSNVIVSAVATKSGRVVAAGRAIVPRVAAGRRARFTVFFIGDPRGARLAVAAPPSAPSP